MDMWRVINGRYVGITYVVGILFISKSIAARRVRYSGDLSRATMSLLSLIIACVTVICCVSIGSNHP